MSESENSNFNLTNNIKKQDKSTSEKNDSNQEDKSIAEDSLKLNNLDNENVNDDKKDSKINTAYNSIKSFFSKGSKNEDEYDTTKSNVSSANKDDTNSIDENINTLKSTQHNDLENNTKNSTTFWTNDISNYENTQIEEEINPSELSKNKIPSIKDDNLKKVPNNEPLNIYNSHRDSMEDVYEENNKYFKNEKDDNTINNQGINNNENQNDNNNNEEQHNNNNLENALIITEKQKKINLFSANEKVKISKQKSDRMRDMGRSKRGHYSSKQRGGPRIRGPKIRKNDFDNETYSNFRVKTISKKKERKIRETN